jgi:hypothetical protein
VEKANWDAAQILEVAGADFELEAGVHVRREACWKSLVELVDATTGVPSFAMAASVAARAASCTELHRNRGPRMGRYAAAGP